MADSSTVLREYLVSLGFQINENQSKKFDTTLSQGAKQAALLTRGLVALGVTVAAVTARYAYSMEKLYYASKRTDSAVSSIQALEYGARRVGVSGDTIRGSLESMARNLRANPGLTGLLNSLGVKVEGRDKSDVLTDLVGQLKQMPFYVAEKYANLFGIDADTLFMLQEGLDEMRKAQELRKQMARDMGVDSDAAAKASKDLANSWREVAERAGLFKDAVLVKMLPILQEMAEGTSSMLQAWALGLKEGDDWMRIQDEGWRNVAGTVHEILKDWREITATGKGSLFERFGEGLGIISPGGRESGVELSKESRERLGLGEVDAGQSSKKPLDRLYDRFMTWAGARKYKAPLADQASVDAAQDTSAFQRGGTGRDSGPSYAPNGRGGYTYRPGGGKPSPEAAALFARLEQQYGLPAGTLDRTWATESNRGQNMTSRAGAKGHFQFMDATGSQYGLDKDGGREDRDDLTKSATAASQMWAYLLKKYKGDARKAAAAYNWGEGNVDRYGLGAAPAETRAYMDKVAPGGGGGVQLSLENNVTITGVSDPGRAAALTREQIDQSNAEVVRNLNSERIN